MAVMPRIVAGLPQGFLGQLTKYSLVQRNQSLRVGKIKAQMPCQLNKPNSADELELGTTRPPMPADRVLSGHFCLLIRVDCGWFANSADDYPLFQLSVGQWSWNSMPSLISCSSLVCLSPITGSYRLDP